jgi:hypothetical protein
MYEVEASKVAGQKATAPDVKDLAVMEVHDHSLVNRELKKIATEKGIPVSPALNATFRQRLEKLNSVSGPEFDAAYIADMEEIHDNDQKLFAKEAMEGSDKFKTFAHQTDLRRYRSRVYEIRGKLYSPAPIIRIGIVGTGEPFCGSTVIANAFASTPTGSGGLITVALPCASGLKTPAGIGAPWVGISHNS